jgi:hypothetical protein
MTHPLRHLRDLTAQIRGVRPAVARASSKTGLLSPHSARVIGFSAAIGAFLSMIGAFGVGDVALIPRTLYFTGMMAAAGVLGCVIEAWTERHAWFAARRWARLGVVGGTLAPVMGYAVWASQHWLERSPQPLSSLPTYVLVASGMSAALTLLTFLVFRARPAPAAAPQAGPARLYARLPVRLRKAEIWALQAEDHYLRVHTSLGSDLILMRLSDAIAELDGVEGAQTHRSWWVAKAAVTDAKRIDERAVLTLGGGIEAPVSRKFAPTLRKTGWF